MPTEPPSPPLVPGLPAVLRLPPHRSVLPLGSDGRLLGLDPAVALAVDRLEPPLAAMLDELVEPVPAAALLERAVQRGGAREVAEQLLRELVAAGAVVDAALLDRRSGHRAESTIVVSGDGPLAVGMVLGLVQAGVGAVYTESAGTVLAGDLGTGHVDADRGHRRAAAIRAAVRRVRPDADAPPATARLVPDLVVLADALAPEPTRLFRLHARGGAHLLVRMRDGVGVIGPLVLPGRTACLGCLDLQRRARAPGWSTVAAYLADRRGRADPAATAATAALGVAQTLAALDSTCSGGDRPPTWEATLELDATAGTVARRVWTPHPDCGCGAGSVRNGGPGGIPHDCVTSADTRDGERIMV
jgi:bacteriocin biosynthesis cyclodehydratase domain-containing protein